MTMEISVRVPPCAPIPRLLEIVRQLEDGGVDRVSFPDSQLLWRDVWATLTAAALATSRIGLSLSVTNPLTRHATVTAGAARTIAEIAPGRLQVAMGIGDSAVTHIGLRSARGAELANAVTAIRTLLAGEEVPDAVHPWRLHDAVHVPVLIAASGPRNLALAGKVADGAVIPGMAWERDSGIVREAALEVGRDPDSLRMVMTRTCVVTDEPERDAALFKPMCLRLAQLGGAPLFEAAGFPVSVPPHDLTLGDLGHPQDWEAAVETCSQWISDEAAMWFARTRALFGTPEDIVEQIAELHRRGVGRLLVAHPGAFSLPVALTEAWVSKVLPLARGRGLVSSA